MGGYLVVGWDGSRRYHVGHFTTESEAVAAANDFEFGRKNWPRVGQRIERKAARPAKTRDAVAERTGLETITLCPGESVPVTPPLSFNELLESIAHPIRRTQENWPESWPNGSVRIDISSPKFPDAFMLCDRVMAERYCLDQKWCVDASTGYAVAKIDGKKASFHRLVTQAEPGILVDHINGDRLDNRMANFRFVNAFQNAWNRVSLIGESEFKGIRRRNYGRWEAAIQVRGTIFRLGEYETEEAAAEAYNHAAKMHFGEYARLNDV